MEPRQLPDKHALRATITIKFNDENHSVSFNGQMAKDSLTGNAKLATTSTNRKFNDISLELLLVPVAEKSGAATRLTGKYHNMRIFNVDASVGRKPLSFSLDVESPLKEIRTAKLVRPLILNLYYKYFIFSLKNNKYKLL